VTATRMGALDMMRLLIGVSDERKLDGNTERRVAQKRARYDRLHTRRPFSVGGAKPSE